MNSSHIGILIITPNRARLQLLGYGDQQQERIFDGFRWVPIPVKPLEAPAREVMAMGRGDDTKHGITIENISFSDGNVSVGAFREFVTRTGYRTDCEKLGGGWVVADKKQWAQRLDACWDNPYMPQEEHDPVVLVSWYDAATFANWKSRRDGLRTAYTITKTEVLWTVEWDRKADGYRLPTEAEWGEHAARAGLTVSPSSSRPAEIDAF